METVIQHLDTLFAHGLIDSGVTIIFTIITLLILNRLLNKLIKKRWSNNLYIAIRVKRVILYTIALSVIFMQIKPLQSVATTLLASGGILAVIIGLASQEAASNMINGFMIFTYKPYVIGDFINIPEHNVKGKVKDIALRHTVMETLEKTQVIIPNTLMNKAVIENISNVPNQKANYLLIDISYESDVQKAIAIIQQQTKKHPLFIDPRNSKEKKKNIESVPVFCTDFKDHAICLRATVTSLDNTDGFVMLSDLRLSIKEQFDQEGIIIPYPHTVLVNK